MSRLCLLLVVACSGRSSAPRIGTRIGPILAAAMTAAGQASTPWRCAASDGPELIGETLGRWRLSGHAMQLTGTGDVLIGVVADASGSVTGLRRLRAKLGMVDLVLSLGGRGATEPELEATLGALAGASPVVAVPGDLEAVVSQAAAIAALRKRGATVIDGRLAHRIELPGVTIATLPGAGSARRLVPGAEGCGYREADVAAAVADLASRPGLRVLASAEPPRGLANGEPTGFRALVTSQIDLALHGPTEEAATPHRTGRRDGNAVALTPGTSDGTTRLPGPRRPPTAALLAIRGETWSWTPITAD